MKKSTLLSFSLVISITLSAQDINFQAADPHPTIQGALMGDNEMADVDGDGDLDLFVCGRIDGWVSAVSTRLYFNDGAGNFSEDISAPFSDVQFASAQFNDIDNDGDQDLLLTGLSDFSVQIAELYINDGTGSFGLLPATSITPCQDAKLDFADVDGDGDDDLYICGSASGNLFCALYINDGAGQFTELAGTSFTPIGAADVKFVDVDGDDDQDIVTMGSDSAEEPFIGLYVNDGNGGYNISESEIEPITISTFAAGDLDQDGDVDVLISGQDTSFSAVTVLYLNDGTGSFSLFGGSDVFTNVSSGQSLIHDLDLDDDLDILLSGSSDGGLGGDLGIITHVYENLGDSNFVLADSLTGSYISNNAIGDINGDGLVDLVLSGTTVGTPTFKTWVYLNTTETSVGLEQLSAESFEVFPNPSNGLINIQLNEFKTATIEIVSLAGEIVFRKQATNSDLISFEINLASGLYNMVIRDYQSISSRRISIVN